MVPRTMTGSKNSKNMHAIHSTGTDKQELLTSPPVLTTHATYGSVCTMMEAGRRVEPVYTDPPRA